MKRTYYDIDWRPREGRAWRGCYRWDTLAEARSAAALLTGQTRIVRVTETRTVLPARARRRRG